MTNRFSTIRLTSLRKFTGFLVGFSLVIQASIAQDLRTFTPGQPATASDVNANFNALLQRINQLESQSSQLSCQTVTSSTQSVVACPANTTITGGGFEFLGGASDASQGMVTSKPQGNGWQCIAADGVTNSVSCFARCCGVSAPDLCYGTYCSTNYCLQTRDPSYEDHVIYAMTLAPGEFRKFPIEIDETFIFPPEDIGVVSLTLRWQDREYHVTNIDEACLNTTQNAFDCVTPWTNVEVLRSAMLSGELEVAPGPLGVLNEFQLVNSSNVAYRIQVWLDQGHVASDASLRQSFVDVYPLESGTGDRDNGTCQEHELDFLTMVAGVPDNETPRTNVAINSTDLVLYSSGLPFIWCNGSAFRILVCEDAQPGNYEVDYVSRDGKGGKSWLGTVNFNVLSETRPGGAVEPR